MGNSNDTECGTADLRDPNAKVLKEGFMEKRGNKMNKNYKKRWCVLMSDGRFTYFVNGGDPKSKGHCLFTGNDKVQRKSVTTFEVESSDRIWSFRCQNVKDCNEWFDCFQVAIDPQYEEYKKNDILRSDINKLKNVNQLDSKKKKTEFERIPKAFPGQHFKDQYPNNKDPRGEPSVIKITWNPTVHDLSDCDTIHLLYLLQNACELRRLRVNERNKFFRSISRMDRYIQHIDTPQIITNFLLWHNEDLENNVFTGKMVENESTLSVADMIANIGCIEHGPSLRILKFLKKSDQIKHEEWTAYQQTLNLFTWGRTKLYDAEKVLEECTVEEVVTLFEYEAEEKKSDHDDAEDVVNGVFAQIDEMTNGAMLRLKRIEDWKMKVVRWIREEKMDGKQMKETQIKSLSLAIRKRLVSDQNSALFKKLNGPSAKLVKLCRSIDVHRVLLAAKSQSMNVDEAQNERVDEEEERDDLKSEDKETVDEGAHDLMQSDQVPVVDDDDDVDGGIGNEEKLEESAVSVSSLSDGT